MLARLRGQAVRLRATHIVLTDGPGILPQVVADAEPKRGARAFVRGDAYWCDPTCEGPGCGKSGAEFLREQLERAEREGLTPSLEIN